MTTSFWKMALWCIFLFMLPSKGDDVRSVAWYQHKENVTLVNVHFVSDHFKQFYECLCKSGTSSCILEYKGIYFDTQDGGRHLFYDSTDITRKSHGHIQSSRPTYQCQIVHHPGDGGEIQCWRRPISCADSDITQEFHYKEAESCDAQCVGVTSSRGQIITFVSSGNSTFQTCGVSGCSNTVSIDKMTTIIVGVILSFVIIILLIILGICFFSLRRREGEKPIENSQSPNPSVSFHNANSGYENSVSIQDEDKTP